MGFNVFKKILIILIFVAGYAYAQTQTKNAQISNYYGKPTIFINDQPVCNMAYALTEEGRFTWETIPNKNLQNFSRHGFELYSIYVYFKDLWMQDGSVNIDTVRKQIDGILTVCPNASIILRVHLDAPIWYNEINIDESVEYASGPVKMPIGENGGIDADRVLRMSFASDKWRNDTKTILRIFCHELSLTPQGQSVIGLHLATGTFGEWHYWGFPEEPDTGKAMTLFFRDWLKDKYGNDELLKTVWNDSNATLATAMVPSLLERQNTEAGIFRDPQKERKIIDYYQCQQKAIADVIIEMGKTAKDSWGRPVLTGVFYGYFFNMFGMMVSGGHLETERILRSPYIDFLCAPISYEIQSRKVGGTGQGRGIMESCRLHDKLWFDEIDHPTYLGDCFGRVAPFTPENLDDSISVMRRNAARALTQGMGAYWFDFGPNRKSGWFDDPKLMAEIQKIRTLFSDKLNTQYNSDADILFVYDDQCSYYMGNRNKDVISQVIIDKMSAEAYRSGVVFDEIRLSDIENVVEWNRYKAVVFANTFLLNDKQKGFIKEKVALNDRNLIWIYAPGYTDGDRLNVDYISSLVGMEITSVCLENPPKIEIVNQDFPSLTFGMDDKVDPFFSVREDDTVAIGKIVGRNYVALAKKRLKNSTSWFCSIPLLSSDLMREIFRDCGAHIYNEENDVVYVGNGILCIHSEKGGNRQIKLRNGSMIEMNLLPHSTTILDSGKGKSIDSF